MASRVHDRPEEQRVGELAMHPEILVERDEAAKDGAGEANGVAEDCSLAPRQRR